MEDVRQLAAEEEAAEEGHRAFVDRHERVQPELLNERR
jgi:hypothetical protein